MTQLIATSREHLLLSDSPGATHVHKKDGGDPAYPAASTPKRLDGEDVMHRAQQTVVIVDRNLLFRAGLIHALDGSPFQIVAECSNIEEVPITCFASNLPILLLIGLERGKIGAALTALRNLRRMYGDLHMIVFFDHDWTGPVPLELAEIGKLVDAMLPKDGIGSESVLKAVDLVLLGTSVVSREFSRPSAPQDLDQVGIVAPGNTRELDGVPVPALPPVASRPAHNHSADTLTIREKLILSHLMKGASNKAIARDVGIAESTVKIHVRNLMLKIDAKNRPQAAMWGYKNL